jgi:HEAT repeat protein
VTEEQPSEYREPATDEPAAPRRKFPWPILVVVALFVIVPFISWYGTWFGRPLSDAQMESYLHDKDKPRNVQHALEQIVNRIRQRDQSVKRWYTDVESLVSYPVPQVRAAAAWTMQHDNSYDGFHRALLTMLGDESAAVRHQAALSLITFGDRSGRAELVAMLKPETLQAQSSGTVELITKDEGMAVAAHAPLFRIRQDDGATLEARAPEAGRIEAVEVADGARVEAGDNVLVLSPETEQVWSALVALYIIGEPEDIPYVQPYLRPMPGVADRIQKQAASTLEAIRSRRQ